MSDRIIICGHCAKPIDIIWDSQFKRNSDSKIICEHCSNDFECTKIMFNQNKEDTEVGISGYTERGLKAVSDYDYAPDGTWFLCTCCNRVANYFPDLALHCVNAINKAVIVWIYSIQRDSSGNIVSASIWEQKSN